MYLMHEMCHAKQNEWPHSENTNCKVNRLGWKTTPPSPSPPPSSRSFHPLISLWTSRMGWMKKGLSHAGRSTSLSSTSLTLKSIRSSPHMTKICLGLETVPLARSNGASRPCTTVIFITPQQTLNCDKRIHIASICLHWSRTRERVIKKERTPVFYLCLFTVFYLALLGAKQKKLPSNEITFVHSSEAETIGNYIWKSIFLHQKHYDTTDLILLFLAAVLQAQQNYISSSSNTYFITKLCKTVILSTAFQSQMLYTTYLI